MSVRSTTLNNKSNVLVKVLDNGHVPHDSLIVNQKILDNAPCSRNIGNVKFRSLYKVLFATQFYVKSVLAKFESQKLPFLQF